MDLVRCAGVNHETRRDGRSKGGAGGILLMVCSEICDER